MDETLKALQDATKDLLYTSESDAPLTPFLWPRAELDPTALPSTLLAKLKKTPKSRAKEVDTDDFYAAQLELSKWATEEDKATVARYTAFLALLKQSVDKPRTFRIGSGTRVEAVTLGQTPSGDWLGVQTQLTET